VDCLGGFSRAALAGAASAGSWRLYRGSSGNQATSPLTLHREATMLASITTSSSATPLPRFWEDKSKETIYMDIQEAVERFMKSRNNCKPKTLRVYRIAIEKLVAFMRAYAANNLQDINGDLLEGFFYSLRTPFKGGNGENCRAWMEEQDWAKSYEPEYLHDIYRPINTMIRYYQRRSLLPQLAYEHPKADSQSRLQAPSDDEFDLILSHVLNPRHHLILLFLGDTGLRREEVTKVNWGDIDWDKGMITLEGKWKKTRAVPLSSSMLDMLYKFYSELPEQDAMPFRPIFLTEDGTRYTGDGLGSVIYRIKQRSNVDFSAHDLRRYALRTWKRAGRTIEDIMLAGGHSEPRTSYRYIGRLEPGITPTQKATNGLDYLLRNGKLKNKRFSQKKADAIRKKGGRPRKVR